MVFEKKDIETASNLMSLVLDEKLKLTMADIELPPNYLKALYVYQWNLTSETKSDFDFVLETQSLDDFKDFEKIEENEDADGSFSLI
jgi:hypothetical protein